MRVLHGCVGVGGGTGRGALGVGFVPPRFSSVEDSTRDSMTAEAFSNVLAERATSRSPRIPFPSGYVSRTQSEIELCLDKERAKQHELKMFHRLVNGIRDRQQQLGMVTDDLPPGSMENIPADMNNMLPFPSFHPGSDRPPDLPPPQWRPTAITIATAAAANATALSTPTTTRPALHVTWLPTTTTMAAAPATVPMAVQDDWSISGFEGQGEDGSITTTSISEHQQPPWGGWNNTNNGRPFHADQPLLFAPAPPPAVLWGSAYHGGGGDDAKRQQQQLHEDDPPEEDIFQLDF
jgi:hypothetical protein